MASPGAADTYGHDMSCPTRAQPALTLVRPETLTRRLLHRAHRQLHDILYLHHFAHQERFGVLNADHLPVIAGDQVHFLLEPIERKRNLRARGAADDRDRKSTRLNSSHGYISYAVFCLKKKKQTRLYHFIANAAQ